MKISELMTRLEAALKEHGDIPVTTMDFHLAEPISHAEVYNDKYILADGTVLTGPNFYVGL